MASLQLILILGSYVCAWGLHATSATLHRSKRSDSDRSLHATSATLHRSKRSDFDELGFIDDSPHPEVGEVTVTEDPMDPADFVIHQVKLGNPDSDDYRVYYRTQHGFISPLHDIPIYADMRTKVCNMIVEVPSMMKTKMELSLDEPMNPLRYSRKGGDLENVYMWNYGSLPTTWSDPNDVDAHIKKLGDGEPLDVFDIGEQPLKHGQIVQVKVLGALGLVSEYFVDWKIMTINVNDSNAARINDVEDIHRHFPGYLNSTVEWYEHYNVPDGKPKNEIAFKGAVRNRKFALKVIDKAIQKWVQLSLVKLRHPGICMVNTFSGQNEKEYKIPLSEAEEVVYKGAMPSVLIKYPPPE